MYYCPRCKTKSIVYSSSFSPGKPSVFYHCETIGCTSHCICKYAYLAQEESQVDLPDRDCPWIYIIEDLGALVLNHVARDHFNWHIQLSELFVETISLAWNETSIQDPLFKFRLKEFKLNDNL